MAWTDIFRSRYVRSLESQLATIRQQHTEETERLKTAHAEAMSRCITEANRGWAEADRLRLFLIPGLPAANRITEQPDTKESVEPPSKQYKGTPFQQWQQQMVDEQEAVFQKAEELRKQQHQFPTPKPPVAPA